MRLLKQGKLYIINGSCIALIIISAISFNYNCKGINDNMEKFDELFDETIISYGKKYRDIRTKIIEMDSTDVAALEDKIQESDWKIRLHAKIFNGWRMESEKCQMIRQIANGTDPSLEGEKYLTGRPPVDICVDAIKAFGLKFFPILLEMIYKEPDLLDDYVFSVCTNTILVWNERDAIPVYKELLMDSNANPAFRELSIQPLLELKADSLHKEFLEVFEEEKNPAELRAAALSSMGTINEEQAFPYLETIFKDPETEIRFRCAAVEGLSETQNLTALDLLAEEYRTDSNDDLKESIISALNDFEDPKALEILKHIKGIESDDGLLELIDEAIEDLEEL
jgi:hypothetical protein